MNSFQVLVVENDPRSQKRLAKTFAEEDGFDVENAGPFDDSGWLKRFAALSKEADPFKVEIIDHYTLARRQNSDNQIPGAEREAEAVARELKVTLEDLGILHKVKLLTGDAVTFHTVRTTLLDGRYHLFHYAGHGTYNDATPEVSGLVFREGQRLRTLTAADLTLLVRDTELRLMYLSCCLGARTGDRVGRGDFYGVFDALARVDVPIVIGYRWRVRDEAALYVARHFYDVLWRTFSPSEALLKARKEATARWSGRDDETWASLILLMQNAQRKT